MSTYIPLQSVTVSTPVNKVTFTNIDQTYTDLIVMINYASSTATDVIAYRAGNGTIDTGSHYSNNFLAGESSSQAVRNANNTFGYIAFEYPTTTFSDSVTMHIQNYSNTTTLKTSIAQYNNPSAGIGFVSNLWGSTAAINTLQFLFPNTSNTFSAGSTFSLYGIRSGGTSKAAGGDIVATDGTYWYHAFLKTGAFVPAVPNLAVDYMVVAGGGGAYMQNGGGGAGGFRLGTGLTLSSTTYPVLIGAGGARNVVNVNANGTYSSFNGISATGGGGGGDSGNCPASANNGADGGSGGGSGDSGCTGGVGGAGNLGGYSPVEGYRGGNMGGSTANGGGGGAGGAGGDGVSGGASGSGGTGAGGTSFTYSGISNPYLLLDAMGSATGLGQYSSSHYYFAGGGGGGQTYLQVSGSAGAGGLGGGGAGGNTSTDGTSGTANTGGGGGSGGRSSSNGGTGGSGLVIVRYAV